MDTNQLQAFEQIARQGSFSKAARVLDVSQPTISVRIRTLEQAVGGRLFKRGGSRLELTELGLSFLPFARQALAVLTNGIDIAQRTTRGEHGRVMIGTLPSLTGGFFAATLARMYTTHPDVSLVVHTGHTQQIIEMLHDGFVKLGFVTWPMFHPELTTILRVQEPLIVVAHPDHPLARRETVTTRELEQIGQPFFHVDWSREAQAWQASLVEAGQSEVEVPPQTAHDLVLSGTGAALLTRTQVTRDLAAGRLIELDVQNMPRLVRESALVRLTREAELPAVVNECIQVFREEIEALGQASLR